MKSKTGTNWKKKFENEERQKDVAIEVILSMINKYRYDDQRRLESYYKKNKNPDCQYPYGDKDIDNHLLIRWNCIPTDLRAIMRDLHIIYQYLNQKRNIYTPSFIDAGCGIGYVPLIAKKIGFGHTVGIDIEPENIKNAKELMYGPTFKIGDIFDEDYSKYDVIYYYCPIKVVEIQKKFELKVEREMKKGAILYPHLKKHDGIDRSKSFKKLKLSDSTDYNVWEKIR